MSSLAIFITGTAVCIIPCRSRSSFVTRHLGVFREADLLLARQAVYRIRHIFAVPVWPTVTVIPEKPTHIVPNKPRLCIKDEFVSDPSVGIDIFGIWRAEIFHLKS